MGGGRLDGDAFEESSWSSVAFHRLLRKPVCIPASFPRVPGDRIQQLPPSLGLAAENRVDLRPTDVPSLYGASQPWVRGLRTAPRRLDAGLLYVDPGLPARGPPFPA